MHDTKIGQIMDGAINDCICFGTGKATMIDGTVIVAEWCENEKDIEVNIIQRGVVLATMVEPDAIDD